MGDQFEGEDVLTEEGELESKEHEVPELEGGEEVDGEAATAGQCLAVLEKEE